MSAFLLWLQSYSLRLILHSISFGFLLLIKRDNFPIRFSVYIVSTGFLLYYPFCQDNSSGILKHHCVCCTHFSFHFLKICYFFIHIQNFYNFRTPFRTYVHKNYSIWRGGSGVSDRRKHTGFTAVADISSAFFPRPALYNPAIELEQPSGVDYTRQAQSLPYRRTRHFTYVSIGCFFSYVPIGASALGSNDCNVKGK